MKPSLALRVTLLAMVAALLPFETREPWLRLGPLELTNLELVLLPYLALSFAIRRRLAKEAWLGLLWVAVLTISALASPFDSLVSLKYAGRVLVGVLLFAAARDDLLESHAWRRVLGALLLGVTLATSLGVIEALRWADFSGAFAAFRTKISSVDGELRLTSTWQQANPASGAIELALMLALAVALRSLDRGRVAFGAIGVALLLAFGNLLTLSRGGMVAAIVGLLCLVGLVLRGTDTRRRAPIARAAAMVLLLPAILAIGFVPAFRTRFTQPAGPVYGVRYEVDSLAAGRPGELLEVPVRLTNTGRLTWSKHGPLQTRLSYHLSGESGTEVRFDGLRTPLPHNLATNEGVTLQAHLHAPKTPGDYLVLWDLVQEQVRWFSQTSSPSARTLLRVRGDDVDDQGAETSPRAMAAWTRSVPDLREPSPELKLLDRGELWSLSLRFFRQHPLLGIGPDQFRRHYASFLPDSASYDPKLHANSLYFELLASTGVLGLLSFLLWTGWLAARLLRRALSPASSIWAATGFSLLVTFLLHGMLDYMLEPYAVMGSLWIGLALCFAASEEPR